jgi:hypothetical protein
VACIFPSGASVGGACGKNAFVVWALVQSHHVVNISMYCPSVMLIPFPSWTQQGSGMGAVDLCNSSVCECWSAGWGIAVCVGSGNANVLRLSCSC